MQSAIQPKTSKGMLWTGRIISGLVILFLLFDAMGKIVKAAPVVEGTARVGYPVSEIVPIGITLLLCVVVYLIPRTSILGAILLTGYLGGATATMVRVQDPLFLMPAGFGVLVWGGLYFRDEALRSLIPLRKPSPRTA
jgi:hypothetical protein